MLRLLNFSLPFVAFSFLNACKASSPEEFDFIIIGGGTAGLTVANRLSQLPDITVAVIEAGGEVFNNPNVTDPEKFTVALGTQIDWQYESTIQSHAAGQKIPYHSGKALGGSSTINGMTYVRAEKSQIDSWEAIGNPGWSWDDLFPYYKKQEYFDYPTAAQIAAGASDVASDHGEDGPLRVGYSYGLLNGSFHETVESTWRDLGIPHTPDANGGHVRGFTVWQSTLDREDNVREDAARAYYYPFQSRPNLRIYLNTTANRILWNSSPGHDAVADGVEITSSDGAVRVLKAKREVILSAGSLRSPAILELSGIGNPRILKPLGIPVKVNVPAVGENLQDQPNVAFTFNTTTTFNGTIPYVTYGSVADFLGDLPKKANLTSWAELVSTAINNTISISTLEHLFCIQYSLLERQVPQAEVIISTTKDLGLGVSSFLFSAFWLLMPFSRGNVHIKSADPREYPEINPNFFLVDFDLDVQVAIAKWTRRFYETEPMKSLVLTELSPGFQVVPQNATDEQWAEYIKTAVTANSHPLGTAAMMPKELGGVVDSNLKVHGAVNVRVVDASVMPTQVSGHLSSTIYAIAEKAADIIKTEIGRS